MNNKKGASQYFIYEVCTHKTEDWKNFKQYVEMEGLTVYLIFCSQ